MNVDPSRLAGLPGLRAYYGATSDLEVEAWRVNHVVDLRAQEELWAHVEVRPTELPDGAGLEITLYALSWHALRTYLASDRTEVRRQAKENGLVYAAVFGEVDSDFGVYGDRQGVEIEGRGPESESGWPGGFEGRSH